MEWTVWSGRSVHGSLDQADATLPPPWLTLEGLAEAGDGRHYGWEISTLDAYRDPQWLDGEKPPPYRPFVELGRTDLFLSETRVPVVLVDAPSFGPELLDFLLRSDPRLRAAWLYQFPAEDE